MKNFVHLGNPKGDISYTENKNQTWNLNHLCSWTQFYASAERQNFQLQSRHQAINGAQEMSWRESVTCYRSKIAKAHLRLLDLLELIKQSDCFEAMLQYCPFFNTAVVFWIPRLHCIVCTTLALDKRQVM